MSRSDTAVTFSIKYLLVTCFDHARVAGAGLVRAAALPVVALMALSAALRWLGGGWPWGVALALDALNMVLGWGVTALYMAVCFGAFQRQAAPGWRAVIELDGDGRRVATTVLAITLLAVAPGLLVFAGFQLFSRSHNQFHLLALLLPAFAASVILYFKLLPAMPAALDDARGLGIRLAAAWRHRGWAPRLFAASLFVNLPLIVLAVLLHLALGLAGRAETLALSELLGTVAQLASTALIAALAAAAHAQAPNT